MNEALVQQVEALVQDWLRTHPSPSGRALTLPEYLAVFGEFGAAVQRYQAAPTPAHRQAYHAAGVAWAQAQADLSVEGRAALLTWLTGGAA
jgi:hypothetical protein